ncbi:MAG: diguanylate cyclase [Gammaproteobacteria bacterium]|nr:diguanylate cyclase [Gammaproteobacteria bacterium]MDH5653738.1 diguanylate cyclase [Gammaproteobacteria bacterium]
MAGIKLKSTRIIVLSTTAILLSIVILILANLYFLHSTNRHLDAIDKQYNQKLDIILRMTYLVRERSMIMLTIYLDDDPWSVDEHYLKYYQLAVDFITLRDRLLAQGLTPEEKQELDKALVFIRQTEPMQNDIVERIRSGGDKMLRHDISRNDLPMEYKLLEIFDRLSAMVRNNKQLAAKAANFDFIRSAFIVTMVSLLILLSIMVLMYRSLRKIQTIEMSLIREADSLGWEATHDPLTNIYNRRRLQHKFDEINQTSGAGMAVHSILYIDLDDFKPINDRYGHPIGDRYLTAFCREVERCIRHNDFFARLGGDEFVVLLENCDQHHAREIAEKIVAQVRDFSIYSNNDRISARCSIGQLSFKPGTNDLDSLLHKADALCYEAKRLGKNNVFCSNKIN